MSFPKYDPTKLSELDKKLHLRPFEEAPETKEQVKVVGLHAIDLSQFKEGPEHLPARQKLAKQLETALSTDGFFKIVNHGIPGETLDYLRAIGQSIPEIPEDEKKNFVGGEHDIEEEKDYGLGVIRGTGFKPRGYLQYTKDARDNVEFYNIRNFLHDEILYNRQKYPAYITEHLDDIAIYFRYLYYNILRKIMNLVDIILELPEGHFWDKHFKVIQNDIYHSAGGVARFLYYHAVDEDYKRKTNGTWLRGHSDQGFLTFIVSQSILALQIRSYDTNEWCYVSHTPNALIVNVADALNFLTGGYFKSALHRVVLPPADQSTYSRGTVIYFCNCAGDTILDPDQLNSPKLARLGYKRDPTLERIDFKTWDNTKGKFFNNKQTSNNKQGISCLGRVTLGSYMEPPKETQSAAGEGNEPAKVAAT